jgi:hypothetical protein
MEKLTQNIEIFNPSKTIKSFKPERTNRIYNGKYYALGKFPNGKILVSENKSIETMHFAQNWIAEEINIIYQQHLSSQQLEIERYNTENKKWERRKERWGKWKSKALKEINKLPDYNELLDKEDVIKVIEKLG